MRIGQSLLLFFDILLCLLRTQQQQDQSNKTILDSENMVPVPTDAPASPLTVRENFVDAENGAHSAMLSCLVVLFAALTFLSSRYFVLFVAVCLPLFSSCVTDC